ncbi:MAG: hypothetical protein QXS41_02285, partial [Candidatus Woesearchaeota archaeon]
MKGEYKKNYWVVISIFLILMLFFVSCWNSSQPSYIIIPSSGGNNNQGGNNVDTKNENNQGNSVSEGKSGTTQDSGKGQESKNNEVSSKPINEVVASIKNCNDVGDLSIYERYIVSGFNKENICKNSKILYVLFNESTKNIKCKINPEVLQNNPNNLNLAYGIYISKESIEIHRIEQIEFHDGTKISFKNSQINNDDCFNKLFNYFQDLKASEDALKVPIKLFVILNNLYILNKSGNMLNLCYNKSDKSDSQINLNDILKGVSIGNKVQINEDKNCPYSTLAEAISSRYNELKDNTELIKSKACSLGFICLDNLTIKNYEILAEQFGNYYIFYEDIESCKKRTFFNNFSNCKNGGGAIIISNSTNFELEITYLIEKGFNLVTYLNFNVSRLLNNDKKIGLYNVSLALNASVLLNLRNDSLKRKGSLEQIRTFLSNAKVVVKDDKYRGYSVNVTKDVLNKTYSFSNNVIDGFDLLYLNSTGWNDVVKNFDLVVKEMDIGQSKITLGEKSYNNYSSLISELGKGKDVNLLKGAFASIVLGLCKSDKINETLNNLSEKIVDIKNYSDYVEKIKGVLGSENCSLITYMWAFYFNISDQNKNIQLQEEIKGTNEFYDLDLYDVKRDLKSREIVNFGVVYYNNENLGELQKVNVSIKFILGLNEVIFSKELSDVNFSKIINGETKSTTDFSISYDSIKTRFIFNCSNLTLNISKFKRKMGESGVNSLRINVSVIGTDTTRERGTDVAQKIQNKLLEKGIYNLLGLNNLSFNISDKNFLVNKDLANKKANLTFVQIINISYLGKIINVNDIDLLLSPNISISIKIQNFTDGKELFNHLLVLKNIDWSGLGSFENENITITNFKNTESGKNLLNITVKGVELDLNKLGRETKVNVSLMINFTSSDNEKSILVLVSQNNITVKYNFDELEINPVGELAILKVEEKEKITLNLSQKINITNKGKELIPLKEVSSLFSEKIVVNVTILNASDGGELVSEIRELKLSDSSDVIKDESSMNLSIRDVNISLDKLGSETKVNITVNITFKSSDNKISKSILVSKNNTRVKYNFDELEINPVGELAILKVEEKEKITLNLSQKINITNKGK